MFSALQSHPDQFDDLQASDNTVKTGPIGGETGFHRALPVVAAIVATYEARITGHRAVVSARPASNPTQRFSVNPLARLQAGRRLASGE